MNVTHNELNYRGDGHDIVISFSPSDFQGGGECFKESNRYKLFQEMTNEKLKYAGQYSDKARKCALEWLSGGIYHDMLIEFQRYRNAEFQEIKVKEDDKLTVENCIDFLISQGYSVTVSK